MKIKKICLITLFAITFYSSCSKDDNIPKTIPNDDKELLKIEQALASNDQNLIALLNKVRGSVGKLALGPKLFGAEKMTIV